MNVGFREDRMTATGRKQTLTFTVLHSRHRTSRFSGGALTSLRFGTLSVAVRCNRLFK